MKGGRGRRVVLLLVVLAIVAAFAIVPGQVDADMNRVLTANPPTPSATAMALHQQLFVADLHADQLLWARDPLTRASRGHVDVPRLQEGNVALQVFSVVTKSPRGINYDRNTDETDNILLLAIAQRWPMATWRSLRARALHQARRLHDAARRSNGALTVDITARSGRLRAAPHDAANAGGGCVGYRGITRTRWSAGCGRHAVCGRVSHDGTHALLR